MTKLGFAEFVTKVEVILSGHMLSKGFNTDKVQLFLEPSCLTGHTEEHCFFFS
jgi:hypothetical protein